MSVGLPQLLLFGEGPSDLMNEAEDGGLKGCLFSVILSEAKTTHPNRAIRTYIEEAWSRTTLNEASSLIQRNELNRQHLPAKFRPDGEEPDRQYVHFSNYAYFLGCQAKIKKADFCVFFHDCDDLSLERLIRAIRRGFAVSRFDGAVWMTPSPTSEAWILAAVKAADGRPFPDDTAGRQFEVDLKPNDKNPHCAKATLAHYVTGNSKLMQLARADYDACLARINTIPDGWSEIRWLPSGRRFVESVRAAVQHLRW